MKKTNRRDSRGPASESTPAGQALSRRELLQIAVAVAPVPLVGCASYTGSKVPMVRNSDPVALAVAYYSDTRDVEADNPLAATHDVSQKCANCIHLRSYASPDRIDCGTFPGRHVSPDGWCSIWAPAQAPRVAES